MTKLTTIEDHEKAIAAAKKMVIAVVVGLHNENVNLNEFMSVELRSAISNFNNGFSYLRDHIEKVKEAAEKDAKQ